MYVSRTGPYVPNLGNFDTLAELLATHPASLYNPGTTAYTADQGIVVSNGTAWEDVGTGGSFALTAATYAAARAISGVSTGDRLEVLGRTTQSDGGQGLFTWVAGGSTTINDGSQLSAPGGIWQRPDTTIQAQWYGIDPTGVAASDVALNLAIQDAIIQKKKLVIPSGIFLLNAPLMCFKTGAGAGPCVVHIEGQGVGVPGSTLPPTGIPGIFQPNTWLFLNSKVVPAVIFQGNRNSSLKNLGIQGINTTPYSSPPTHPTDVRTDYIISGCPTTFQSPYCGIAIDPFTASAPADGGYSGLGASYGPAPSGSGSSNILFENISIAEFVVGVALSTAGCAQGDLMCFRNLNVNYCETGFACGDSQARDCHLSEGSIATCRQAFDTINYGTTTPANPIVIENMNFGNLYRILALTNQSPCFMKSCYAESIKTLGEFGKNLGGNPYPMVFESCHWSIAMSWGAIPPIFFESPSPTVFKGCGLQTDSGNTQDAWNIVCWGQTGGGCSFENCNFQGSAFTDLPPYIAIDFNARCGAHLKDCTCQSASTVFQISDDFLRNNGISYIANGKGRLRATWQMRYVADNNLTYNYQPATTSPVVQCNGVASSLAIVSNQLNFQETTLGEVQVNDILMWKMLVQGYSGNQWVVPAWKVASVDGSGNVVANPIWDITQYDTVASTIGSMYGADKIGIVRHQWAPTTALTGNTHSNTTLDTLSTSALINGDWVQGVGIPANTRVVSGGGTASVVLSKAATSTLTGINLYDGQLVASQQQGVYFPQQAGNTGAAPVPTFALGAVQAWTLSAATTWGAPTGAWVAGNRLTLLVTSTGAFTTAWNAVYRNAPAWAVAANGQKATAEFMYDGTNWQFIGGSAAFA